MIHIPSALGIFSASTNNPNSHQPTYFSHSHSKSNSPFHTIITHRASQTPKMPKFTIQPPNPAHATLSYPAPHVLLVTLNRPRDLNCINAQGHADLHAVWEWLDEEPSMRVGIITGKGRAFCAGADLKGPYTAIDMLLFLANIQQNGTTAPPPLLVHRALQRPCRTVALAGWPVAKARSR